MFDVTTILLCGGKGERLRPFTNTMPKALVSLNGQPLLYHLLRYLSAEGLSRFITCVGYKAEAIEEFLNDHRERFSNVTCVNSGEASMTDRILDAQREFSGKALICYGDTLANVDIKDLCETHAASGAVATLTTYPLRSPFGIVHFDDTNRISSFVEKPALPYWINIGFILCEPEAFAYLRPNSDMSEFLSELAESGKLQAYRHTGKHLTVNTEKERANAEIEMVEFFTYMDGQTR
jgi:glucose-1-phosphate cytidylyltransferase